MGFFDRFRRSSKSEPEEQTPRGGGSEPGSRSADKPTQSSSDGGPQTDQELIDAIAALVGGNQSGVGDATTVSKADDEPLSVTSPVPESKPESGSGSDEDLLASLVALLGQETPEPESAPAPQPSQEPEPEPESGSESDEDLLASLAALLGQETPEPESAPSEEPSEEPEPSSDDNPFSAIAALLEQEASDSEPEDEPAPSGNDDGGEDLFSSIASIMGGSMYASDQVDDDTPSTPAIDPALEEAFASMCAESKRFFDKGALADALAMYLQACATCKESVALEGMAFHHAAAFAIHQVGDGFSAAEYSRESLERGDAFRAYAQEHLVEGQPNAHMESLQIAAMTSTSYDEALEYADRGVELYGEAFGDMAEDLRQFRAEHPRFADYQRKESLKHYSRVSADEDAGDYAPAMALMDIILRNAREDAYQLAYDEQVQILDDYGTITIMHALGKARASGLSQDDFAEELSFVADGALFRLADFMSECQPADKQKFDRIIQGMKMLPGVSKRIAFEPFR